MSYGQAFYQKVYRLSDGYTAKRDFFSADFIEEVVEHLLQRDRNIKNDDFTFRYKIGQKYVKYGVTQIRNILEELELMFDDVNSVDGEFFTVKNLQQKNRTL